MNRFALSCLATAGIVTAVALPHISYAQGTHTGIVERVWEDGLRLNTGDRSFNVDTWEVLGDSTPRYLVVGDQITITGEFSGRTFDAFTINHGDTPANTEERLPLPSPASSPVPASSPNPSAGPNSDSGLPARNAALPVADFAPDLHTGNVGRV